MTVLLMILSLWSVPKNHDLGFEGKPTQPLAAAAETGECVSYRSMPSFELAVLQVNGLDRNGLDGYRRKPRTENSTPISQLWAELLCLLRECGVKGVLLKTRTPLGSTSKIKPSTQITTQI